MVARYLLYGVLACALAISLWVGLRRMAWDAAYQTVGIVVPAQEIDSSLSDGELRDVLTSMRVQGVVALSVEFSDFPDWNLERADSRDSVVRVLRAAQASHLKIVFVVDADRGEMPSLALRPDSVMLVSEQGSVVPSWIVTDFRDALLGIVEFSEPAVLIQLYRWGWRNFVRVHAIKARELDRLGLEGTLARWERAVQERSIRLLWVTEHRKFPEYLEHLSRRIVQLGMKLGQPSAPVPFESSYWVYLIVGAGFVGFALLTLMSFSQRSISAILACGLIGSGALAALGAWDFERARQALALMIAALAPWFVMLVSKERWSGWKLLVAVSLGSSCAGLAVAALLSDLSYFLKINEFRGVKIALVAPSVLMVLSELWRWRGPDWGKLLVHLKRGAWLVPVLGFGALFFVLERSGNLPAIPVARWEEFLRERLEDWLTAPPRFKEFLVGHPALMLWKNDHSFFQLGVLALGALGQASIINTFVHLHTPLALSLWRTANGLVLGILIGLGVRALVVRVERWRRRS